MEINIKNVEEVVLRCVSVKFYSPYDEDIFFAWIHKIKCITSFAASGVVLELYIPSDKINDQDLDNLIGLFRRYKINMPQLKIFLNESNKEWFANPIKIWHKEIFKDSTNSREKYQKQRRDRS